MNKATSAMNTKAARIAATKGGARLFATKNAKNDAPKSPTMTEDCAIQTIQPGADVAEMAAKATK